MLVKLQYAEELFYFILSWYERSLVTFFCTIDWFKIIFACADIRPVCACELAVKFVCWVVCSCKKHDVKLLLSRRQSTSATVLRSSREACCLLMLKKRTEKELLKEVNIYAQGSKYKSIRKNKPTGKCPSQQKFPNRFIISS